MKSEGLTVGQTIIGKDNGGSNRSYQLYLNSNGYLLATYFLAGTLSSNSRIYSPITGDGNWHFIVMWYDTTSRTLNLRLDNAAGLGETGTATGTSTLPSTLIDFQIGARQFGGAQDYFDGLIDEVGFWRRVLTPAERTTLYNGGAGLTYPFA